MTDNDPPVEPAANDKSGKPSKPKGRSLSFGSNLKPKTSSSDGNKSDSGSATGIGSGRLKGFLASLASKKKQSATSLSSSDAPTNSSSGDGDKAKETDLPATTGPPPSRSDSSLRLATIPQGGSEIMERSTSSRTERRSTVDPLRQAVVNAEGAVDKLQTAFTILTSIAQIASVAEELLPGVGAAVGIVANMVKSAKTVAVNKVTALRLVERCATILLAVQQAMIDTKGQVTPAMRINIERLLTNLHGIADLLSRIATKAFFEQYFKADEYSRQIVKAGEDLSDFVQIFELQNQIDVGAWRQQMMEDREKDVAMLTGRLQDILDRGGDIIRVMEIQSEQQQEAIAALQRRVDQIATMHVEELYQHHPDSPSLRFMASLPPIRAGASTILPSRDGQDSGLGLNIAAKPQPQVETESGDKVPAPKPAELQRRFSKGHRQFEEKALEALRRVSGDTQSAVPDWVITFLEVSREERVKTGFFSEVWKGSWQEQTVAIKLLSPTADKALFIKEVEVWRRLRSPYILPFLGASSTTGPPPWMLISPYMRNGNIIDYLQTPKGKRCDKFAMIHQIALGMDYLLSRDILHGDLKANNILINDSGDIHICDFGLSQLKTDIKRKSLPATNDPSTQGALRWQSPERLSGGRLTWRCDVYSFAMVIYEIFSEGAVPFGQVDDKTFRRNIMKGLRPPRPDKMPEKLWLLTARCWAQDPKLRPKFTAIGKEIAQMYTPRDSLRQGSTQTASSESTDNETAWATASEGESEEDQQLISPTPHLLPLAESFEEESSSASSLRSIPSHLEHAPSNESDRAEKHYRHYLSHDFDDRLSIALWFPSPVALGAVGYIRHGQFVKLLDAHSPPTGIKTMPPTPYLDEFSSLHTNSTPINVRSGLEKNLDRFVAWTKFTKSSGETSQKPIVRHLDFPLKPGRRQAALVVEDAQCEIYQSFDEARSYLTDNIGWILDNFGETHHIGREDVIIIVGTLTAQHYAMIISDFSPRTTLKFNVHAESARGPGGPWGTWSFVQHGMGAGVPYRGANESGANSPISPKGSFVGPLPRPAVDERRLQYTCKVSNISGSPREAVLLARLKFAPGETDPTLYP